jgi:hypothetical protein
MMNTHRAVLAIFAAALLIAAIGAYFDDVARCRHSQRRHRSAAGHDRFGSTPSAVAPGSYQPELIDNCCAAGGSPKSE